MFLDSTRAGGATVVAAYSPRIRPGVPVSFPLPWDELDRVSAGRLHRAHRGAADRRRPAVGRADAGAAALPADLVEEGRAIPIARVQAMHEGKRRARARRAAGAEGAEDG